VGGADVADVVRRRMITAIVCVLAFPFVMGAIAYGMLP
jgi:hypothetical protein